MHPWGSKYAVNAVGLLIEAGYGQYSNCIFEGSDVCQIVLLAGSTNFAGCHVFGTIGGTGYNTGGLQIGQAAPSTTLKSGATTTPIVLTTIPGSLPPGVQLSFVVTGLHRLMAPSILPADSTSRAHLLPIRSMYRPTAPTRPRTPTPISRPSPSPVTGITAFTITVNGLGVPYPYSNFQTVPGATNGAGGTTTSVQAGGCHFVGSFDHCEGPSGAVLFANDGGNTDIQASVYQTGGTVIYAGTIAGGSSFRLLAQGLTSDATLKTAGGSRMAANSNNALTVSDRTTDVFNVAANAKRIELPNNAILKTYSDNYSTEQFRIDTSGILRWSNDTVLKRGAQNILATNGTFALNITNQGAIASSGTITVSASVQGGIRVAPAAE